MTATEQKMDKVVTVLVSERWQQTPKGLFVEFYCM
jgi:hypothetical protein